jgi:hypothetical protein
MIASQKNDSIWCARVRELKPLRQVNVRDGEESWYRVKVEVVREQSSRIDQDANVKLDPEGSSA